ncbi:MAG: LON peptidase substrate-binding domain-containing protein, partial [Phycisphaerae bacterium]
MRRRAAGSFGSAGGVIQQKDGPIVGISEEELQFLEDDDGEASNEEEITPDGLPLAGAIAPLGGSSESSSRPKIPELLPVLPIRDTVVFPGTIVPLTVGRDKSKRLVADIYHGSKILGVVAQRRSETEDPTLDDLYRVGTVVAVLKRLELGDGSQSIIVHGLTRFGIEILTQAEPYLVARAHPREDTFTESTEIEAHIETARRLARRVIELTPGVPEEALAIMENIEKPGALGDFLAANLTIDLVKKQEILETFDVADRLRKIHAALATQLEILELSNKIHSRVKEEIDKSQREYYLQEQLQAIQKELGVSDGREAELGRIKEAIAKAKMPETVGEEAKRELDRLGRMHQASPEYSGILDYLEWLCELPWSLSTEDKLDITRAEEILNADHYDLDKVKKRILEFLAV